MHAIIIIVLSPRVAIHRVVLQCDISDITNHSTDTYLLISPRTISRYQLRKNRRNKLLMIIDALIGEYNLKQSLAVHKKVELIGRVFWVISRLNPRYIRMISLCY